MVESFRGLRKFSADMKYTNTEIAPAKSQSAPSSDEED
jgi:hypothetical protein